MCVFGWSWIGMLGKNQRPARPRFSSRWRRWAFRRPTSRACSVVGCACSCPLSWRGSTHALLPAMEKVPTWPARMRSSTARNTNAPVPSRRQADGKSALLSAIQMHLAELWHEEYLSHAWLDFFLFRGFDHQNSLASLWILLTAWRLGIPLSSPTN